MSYCPETAIALGSLVQDLTWSPNKDAPVILNAVITPLVWKNVGHTVAQDGPAFTISPDATASSGFAVEWQVPNVSTQYGVQSFEGNRPPASINGGIYVVSLRCRSTVSTPPGSTITVEIRSSAGHTTFDHTNAFNISGLGSTYQIFTWTTPTLSWDNSNFAFLLPSGGFNGLLIDYCRIDQTSTLQDSVQLSNRGLTGWPVSPPTVTTSNNVWYGEGLYYDNFKIVESMNALGGITFTEASWFTFGKTRGFDGSTAITSPTNMATYKLLILNNLDLRTFYYDARDWLRGYVNAGGRILMCGGVYSCGRGYWQESDLIASMLPVTLTNFDLQASATPLTVQTIIGSIYSSSITSPPVCLWNHTIVAKGGAVNHLTVGSDPGLITWSYGAGKVAILGVTPLGVIGSNSVWWQHSEWQSLVIQPLLTWLLT